MHDEGRRGDRGSGRGRGPPGTGAPLHAPREATALFRKAVALHPFIDDDWPEYRRALPRMRDEQVVVAWLLRWGRSREQIAEIAGMGLSTVKNHAAYLRDRLEVRDCRDIGPKTGHLVNVLRVSEGRLTLESGARAEGDGTAGEPPARPDPGRRPRMKPGRDGGDRAPPPG